MSSSFARLMSRASSSLPRRAAYSLRERLSRPQLAAISLAVLAVVLLTKVYLGVYREHHEKKQQEETENA